MYTLLEVVKLSKTLMQFIFINYILLYISWLIDYNSVLQ
jgi:hypothetical protein